MARYGHMKTTAELQAMVAALQKEVDTHAGHARKAAVSTLDLKDIWGTRCYDVPVQAVVNRYARLWLACGTFAILWHLSGTFSRICHTLLHKCHASGT